VRGNAGQMGFEQTAVNTITLMQRIAFDLNFHSICRWRLKRFRMGIFSFRSLSSTVISSRRCHLQSKYTYWWHVGSESDSCIAIILRPVEQKQCCLMVIHSKLTTVKAAYSFFMFAWLMMLISVSLSHPRGWRRNEKKKDSPRRAGQSFDHLFIRSSRTVRSSVHFTSTSNHAVAYCHPRCRCAHHHRLRAPCGPNHCDSPVTERRQADRRPTAAAGEDDTACRAQ